jgi:hypothetical protein
MNGTGELFCLHDRLQADLDIVRFSHLTKAELAPIRTIPFHNLAGVVSEGLQT